MGYLAAVVVAAGLMATGRGWAATSDCAQITNFASATYDNTQGVGYTVSYNATADVQVATPNVYIGKTATPTLQGAGGVVQFCITYQNVSYCASAFNVTVVDRTPDGMNVVSAAPVIWSPGGIVWDPQEYASMAAPNTWVVGNVPVGQVGPYNLRWVADVVSPRRSGMICYSAVVQ